MAIELTHGSLFTGIGGFDLGMERAGFTPAWQVEKEPFCNAVLKTHWPNVRRFTDVREVGKHNLERVTVLSGGFPCQDVSVAGRRAGLSGERTGLFFEATRIIGEVQPHWFVLENVPGLFSSSKGEDFKVVIETLCELGYGVAWRTLDSQYFGVAQRRRRVYIVGSFGRPCPAEILFESPRSTGDSSQGGEARPRTSHAVARSITQSCWKRHDEDTDTLDECVAYPLVTALRHLGHGGPDDNEAQGGHLISATLDAHGMRDFAELPEGLDSARYRALGNAVTTNVAEWIGRRIAAIERGDHVT